MLTARGHGHHVVQTYWKIGEKGRPGFAPGHHGPIRLQGHTVIASSGYGYDVAQPCWHRTLALGITTPCHHRAIALKRQIMRVPCPHR